MQAKGILDSNDWLKANLSLPDNAHILDAGCGVGGTLFALLGEGNTAVGITLSQTQVAVAQRIAKQLNVASRCRFYQQSYDAPLTEKFDIIISIEALTHSQHLATSLQNLMNHLKPNGQLVIFEDMAGNNLSTHPLSKIWQQSWCLETVHTQHDYLQAIDQYGLKIIKTADFTPYIQTFNWPSWFIKYAWQLVNKLPASLQGSKDIFVGGWALEKLYRQKLITYQMIIAKKY